VRRTGAPTLDQQVGASPAADGVCCLPPPPRAVYQDHKEEKLKGVRSLIQYATMCEYMLVPTEEGGWCLYSFPHRIPGYGTRGWW